MPRVLRWQAALVLAGLALSSTQAQETSARLPEPEVRTLTTSDSFPIKITYYAQLQKKETAPVILLHGKDGNRFIWQGGNGFAEVLHKAGYAVVTVDLRHHGESRATPVVTGAAKPAAATLRPIDYQAMVAADLPAVKKFLMQEHHESHLNINKLALIGAGMGGTVAVDWALLDWQAKPYPDGPDLATRTPRGQDVRAIVLISPDPKVPGLPLAKAIGELRRPEYNTAFLLCAAKLSSADKADAATLYKQLTTFPDAAKRMYKYEYSTKLIGTEMLNKGLELERHMLVFLDKHSKGADSQWRNRKSRLEDVNAAAK